MGAAQHQKKSTQPEKSLQNAAQTFRKQLHSENIYTKYGGQGGEQKHRKSGLDKAIAEDTEEFPDVACIVRIGIQQMSQRMLISIRSKTKLIF